MRERDRIEYVKSKIMPHLKKVTEARELVDEIMKSVGDELDPENELEEAESQLIGVEDHPDFYATNPLGIMDHVSKVGAKKELYRKIVLGKGAKKKT